MEQIWKWIRYSLDPEGSDEPDVKELDWQGLYRFACEQAIAGVVFDGVKRLGENGVKPPFGLLMDWLALAQRIEGLNKLVNRRCVELTERLRKDGFESCILKGQGNTLLYPNPYSRTSGDIDIIVLPPGNLSVKERRKVVTDYVKRLFPKTRIRYQHIDYKVFPDVEVEMHFIPTAKNNPLYNKRIQRWVEEKIHEQCLRGVELPGQQGTVAVPTVEFNVVYQLSHLMHHFFDEGIGLRQMMDYYLLLKTRTGDGEDLKKTLRHLGLYHFAGAVMYVMREVFGLPEEKWIVAVDERRGRTLMNEILKGGNFGKYSGLTQHSTGCKYFLKHWRNLHFVREYPSEALCEPVFRTWHFFWRLRQL